jgi:hypothetical protein
VLKLFGNLLKRKREVRKRMGRRRIPRRNEQIHREHHEESYVPDHTRSDTRPWAKKEN